MRSRSFTVGVVFVLSLTVFGHTTFASQCNLHLNTKTSALVLDDLLNELSELETQLQNIVQENYNQNLDLILAIQDELNLEIEVALDADSESALQNVKANLDSFKVRVSEWTENLNNGNNEEKVLVIESETINLNDFPGFHALEADVEYQVISAHLNDRSTIVIFPERLLRELTNNKLSLRVQKDLFGAVTMGFVYSNGMRGLKVMTTYEGIRFVEAKVIGGEAGNYRIYGCLEGVTVNFHFLGEDTNGSSDPNRVKIKNICK